MHYHQILASACLLLIGSSPSFAGNYQVDKAASVLAVDMHASPSHDFTSVAKDYTCDIEIEPGTLSVKKAVCSFKFADMDSGKNSRDLKMCRWMDIENYPSARFEMIEQLADNATGEHVARGKFTMHGEAHPITINYILQQKGSEFILEGRCTLDHRKWGLDKVRLLFFSVDPVLKPHFRLVGQVNEKQGDG